MEERQRLELGLRTALEETREILTDTTVKPAISLKLDFGSVD